MDASQVSATTQRLAWVLVRGKLAATFKDDLLASVERSILRCVHSNMEAALDIWCKEV